MQIKGGPKKTVSELVAMIEAQPLQIFVSFKSKVFFLFITFIFSTLGAASIWWAYQEGSIEATLGGAFFFLIGTLIGAVLLKKFGRGGPAFEINKQGLKDFHFHQGVLIPWSDINFIGVYKQNHTTYLGLYLHDINKTIPTNKVSQGTRALNKRLKLPDIGYPQALLGGQKASVVAETLKTLKAKYENPFNI